MKINDLRADSMILHFSYRSISVYPEKCSNDKLQLSYKDAETFLNHLIVHLKS